MVKHITPLKRKDNTPRLTKSANFANPVKRSKYGNKKTEIDGFKFDSKKEANRYRELKILLNSGFIADLKLQVKHDIIINGGKACSYISDFEYYDNEKCMSVIEDVKGMKTGVYRLKKRLMKLANGIEITEV
jgi:ribosomal protein S8